MKFQFSGHVILCGYEMSPGQFSSKKRTNYDFFGYVKDWPYDTNTIEWLRFSLFDFFTF